MKAAVCYGSGKPLVLEERPDPTPGPGEVVLRVERCGICGSELHVGDGGHEFPGGLVMGHEFAGTIVALGEGVTGLAERQRVVAYPAAGCGNCPACAQGNHILCNTASRLMGGWAEYAVVPAASALTVPGNLTPADAALIEPLTVSCYGVKQAALRPGDRVAVLGAGTIALAAIYWARRLGAGRIVCLSRSERRKDMALKMGADAFVAYGENEVAEAAETLGGPAHVVFEAAGAAGMLAKSIAHVELLGQVVSLGFGSVPDPIVPAVAGFRGVTVKFPLGYSHDDFRFVAREMTNGHVDPKAMITSTIALAQVPAKFEELLGPNQESKVQIAPWDGR